MKKSISLKFGITTLMSLVLTTALSVGSVKAAECLVTRTNGADRYQTAAQVATKNWTSSKELVLVSGEGYADAVSASVLAKTINVPILLTTAGSLNADAKVALDTLKPTNIYVVGGNASISQTVRNQLKANYTLVELQGKNRYETNVAVANELVKNHGVKADNVMLVGGEGFSDALSVAPVASAKGQILLLGNNNDTSMQSVISFVKTNKSAVKVVGTKNVINDEMMNKLGTNDRINGGSDRFDTNLRVLNSFKSDLKMDKMFIANASGQGYADALVASALAGKTASPLVLVDNQRSSATPIAIKYIKDNYTDSTSSINVIGGKGVVSDVTFSYINYTVNPNTVPPVDLSETTRGNSLGNQINSGKVAYKDNTIYFSNPQDGGKLYKCNVDGSNKIKLSDDVAFDINLYGDSIFYLKRESDDQFDSFELYKINNDGSSRELFVKDKVTDDFQIVNDYGYYAIKRTEDPANHVRFYYPKDVYKVSLVDNTKTNLGLTIAYNMYVKDDGWLYGNDRYTLFKQNINNLSEKITITESLWNANIKAMNNNKIFYISLHVPYDKSSDVLGLCKANFSPSSIFVLSEAEASAYFATDNNLYEVIDKKLYLTEGNSTDKKLVKELDIMEDKDKVADLYMVKDKFCYFNSKGEIIIEN